MIDFTTLPCIECGQTTTVKLDAHQFNLWKKMGYYVQDAFPEKTPEERELLITGTHSDCWNRIMAHPFEEWDYDEMCANCGEPENHDVHKVDYKELNHCESDLEGCCTEQYVCESDLEGCCVYVGRLNESK